jgi:hypothetical protein
MADPDLSAQRPAGAQAQPEPHAAGSGGQAAKLKDAQSSLPNAIRHHPVVLE